LKAKKEGGIGKGRKIWGSKGTTMVAYGTSTEESADEAENDQRLLQYERKMAQKELSYWLEGGGKGRAFIQKHPCYVVFPSRPCHECAKVENGDVRPGADVVCQFQGFRKLQLGAFGRLARAGFLTQEDASEDDRALWQADGSAVFHSLSDENARFILEHVSKEFCRLVDEEEEAVRDYKRERGEDALIIWKRLEEQVSHCHSRSFSILVTFQVREMCDVCSTTIFNVHFSCASCCILICLDCVKTRRRGATEYRSSVNDDSANSSVAVRYRSQKHMRHDRDQHLWPLCHSRRPHDLSDPGQLLLTKIICDDAHLTLRESLHQVWRSSLGRELDCVCVKRSKENVEIVGGILDRLVANIIGRSEINANQPKEEDNRQKLIRNVSLRVDKESSCTVCGQDFAHHQMGAPEIRKHLLTHFREEIADLVKDSVETANGQTIYICPEADCKVKHRKKSWLVDQHLGVFHGFLDELYFGVNSSNQKRESQEHTKENEVIARTAVGELSAYEGSSDARKFGNRQKLMQHNGEAFEEERRLRESLSHEDSSDGENARKRSRVEFNGSSSIENGEEVEGLLQMQPSQKIAKRNASLEQPQKPQVSSLSGGTGRRASEDLGDRANSTSHSHQFKRRKYDDLIKPGQEFSLRPSAHFEDRFEEVNDVEDNLINLREQALRQVTAGDDEDRRLVLPATSCERIRLNGMVGEDEAPQRWLCDGKLLVLEEPQNEANMVVFKEQWRRGQPIVAGNSSDLLDSNLWHPKAFLRDFGSLRHTLVNCLKGTQVPDAPLAEFWRGFMRLHQRLTDEDGRPMLLKLKDWPPNDDIAEFMPDRFDDLINSFSMPDYTLRDGPLNLAMYLPDRYLKPELGPKMYIAYGSALYASKGSTNLHIDMSDAVNCLVYVGMPEDSQREDNERLIYRDIEKAGCDIVMKLRSRRQEDAGAKLPGALWHIFHPTDTPKIRHMLKRIAIEKGKRLDPHDDPIHDQSTYLDGALRMRLYQEYGVRGTIMNNDSILSSST